TLKCLAKHRDQRYATARDLQEDLARFLADEPVVARMPSVFERAGKALRRHRVLVGVALAGSFVAATALGGVLATRWANARSEALVQLLEGDRCFKAKAFDKAEQAYLDAARVDGPHAAEA